MVGRAGAGRPSYWLVTDHRGCQGPVYPWAVIRGSPGPPLCHQGGLGGGPALPGQASDLVYTGHAPLLSYFKLV